MRFIKLLPLLLLATSFSFVSAQSTNCTVSSGVTICASVGGFSQQYTTGQTPTGPKYNAMNCSSPSFSGKQAGEVACYGVWDYGNEFGDDKDMCQESIYGKAKTGCVVKTTACVSGSAIATRVLFPNSSSQDIATMASNFKTSISAVSSSNLLNVWEYTCQGTTTQTAPNDTSPVLVTVNGGTFYYAYPVISGYAFGVSALGLVVSNNGGKVYGSGNTITVDSNGKWSHTISSPLSNGDYQVIVYDTNNMTVASGTITVLLDAPVTKATYKGYLGGSETPFIVTENIPKTDALDNCKINSNNNPTKSIMCTWNGVEIYSYPTTTTATNTTNCITQNGVNICATTSTNTTNGCVIQNGVTVCSTSGSTNPPLPTTSTEKGIGLAVSSESVMYGDIVDINWQTNGFKYCSSNWNSRLPISGNYKVKIYGDRTFTVNCYDASANKTTKSVRVILKTPTVEISATPTSLEYSKQAQITWSSADAASCNWVKGDTQFIRNENTTFGTNKYTQPLYKKQTYTIRCKNGSKVATKSVTIDVACKVLSVYRQKTPGLATYDIYMRVSGLSSNVTLPVAISGTKTWNSLKFEKGSNVNTLKANQTFNLKASDIILSQKNNISLVQDGETVCKSVVVPVSERAVCGLFRGGTDTATNMIASPNPAESVADNTDNACSSYCDASNPVNGDMCLRGSNVIKTYSSTATNTSGVTLARTAGFVVQNISPNSTGVKIGSFTIQNNLKESISLGTSTVNLSFSGAFSDSNMSNLSVRISNGSTVGIPVGNVSAGTNYFSFTPIIIPEGGVQTLDVYADIGGATSGAVTASMEVFYYGNTSPLSGSANAAGVAITPVVASLADPVLVASSPLSQFMIGGTANDIAKFKLKTQTGDVVVKKLRFKVLGTDSVISVSVNGVTAVPVISSEANVSGISIPVSTIGTDLQVSVKFNGFVNSTTGGSLTQGVSPVSITLDSIEATSGSGSVITKQTSVSSNPMTLVASKPTVIGMSGRGILLAGKQKLGEFTVSADANGKIAVSKVSLVLLKSTSGTLDITNVKISEDNGATAISNVVSNPVSGQVFDLYLSSYANNYEIGAGQSKTFQVWGDISGSFSAAGTSYVSLVLNKDEFKWVDVVGGNKEYTGNGIINFPVTFSSLSNSNGSGDQPVNPPTDGQGIQPSMGGASLNIKSNLSSNSSNGQVLGASTLNLTCANITYNLHRGAESKNVSKLQNFLKEKGFLNEVTGFYGDKTIEAVKDYQGSIGLPVTGMVYPATREAIRVESCN